MPEVLTQICEDIPITATIAGYQEPVFSYGYDRSGNIITDRGGMTFDISSQRSARVMPMDLYHVSAVVVVPSTTYKWYKKGVRIELLCINGPAYFAPLQSGVQSAFNLISWSGFMPTSYGFAVAVHGGGLDTDDILQVRAVYRVREFEG